VQVGCPLDQRAWWQRLVPSLYTSSNDVQRLQKRAFTGTWCRSQVNNNTNTFLFLFTSTRHDVGESSFFQNVGNTVHCHMVGTLKNESKLIKPFLKILVCGIWRLWICKLFPTFRKSMLPPSWVMKGWIYIATAARTSYFPKPFPACVTSHRFVINVWWMKTNSPLSYHDI
jgi:hypothetical protein